MGSVQSFETPKSWGGRPGKIDAPLNKKLSEVKWGEFTICDLFNKINVKSLKYKASDLPNEATTDFNLPALTAGIQNQGLNNYVPKADATVLKNVISISANGANTGATFYQSNEFTVLQDAYAINWSKEMVLTDNSYLFLTAAVSKAIYGNYEWTNKAGWERIKFEKIYLPITEDDEIDFAFMENFIAELEAERIKELEAERIKELEAYLTIAGLKNYELTNEEHEALDSYKDWEWNTFNLEDLFGKSTRGRRLKSADRIPGELPFVTAGEADEGISDFIGNDVTVFSENTTTIDMFGSAKYRNYRYGGDDHVAIVHTEALPKLASIFVTSAIHKSSHNGQFDYSKNFYAKDADALNIQLPSRNGLPDYDCMATFISAIQKEIIKDVVLFANRKIGMAKKIVNK